MMSHFTFKTREWNESKRIPRGGLANKTFAVFLTHSIKHVCVEVFRAMKDLSGCIVQRERSNVRLSQKVCIDFACGEDVGRCCKSRCA